MAMRIAPCPRDSMIALVCPLQQNQQVGLIPLCFFKAQNILPEGVCSICGNNFNNSITSTLTGDKAIQFFTVGY